MIALNTRRRWGVRRTVQAVLLVAAVGVTASIWHTDVVDVDQRYLAITTLLPDQPTTLQAGDVTVTAPAGTVDRSARLWIGPPIDVSVVVPGVSSGPGYVIHIDGAAQQAPLTVTLALPDDFNPEMYAWVGHRRFDGTWTAEQATVDLAAGTITAEVDDLSLFSVQWLDLRAWRARLAEVVAGSLQGATSLVMYGSVDGPQQPLCPKQSDAARRGVSIEVTGAPVPSCAGLVGDRVRVQLVNTRPYPVLLRYPDQAHLHSRGDSRADLTGVFELVVAELPGSIRSNATVLRAGESAELIVEQGAAEVVLHLEPSGAAMVAAALNSALMMLADFYLGMAKAGLVRLPAGLNDPAMLAGLWDLARCGPQIAAMTGADDVLGALVRDLPDVIGCAASVAADVMAGNLVGLVAGAVGAVASVVLPLAQQLTGSVTSLVDMMRGADTSTLAVRVGDAGSVTMTHEQMDSPVVLLVVDVSGSMAHADSAGTIRIEGAKDAIHTALDSAPPGALFGLRTFPDSGGFGGSCSPGALRYGWVNATDSGLREAVDQLGTGGDTPTGPALRAAADQLLALNLSRPATIVLVSDGESNCGPDPCVVADEIAADGLAIVHTVGFEISESGRAELDCISSTTGGAYFDANDSAALARHLGETASPRLELTLDSPSGQEAPVGGLVTISVTVANPSPQQVDEVRVQIGLSATSQLHQSDLLFQVSGPSRSLGNLAPGQDRQLQWQFRVPVTVSATSTQLTVSASARNATRVAIDDTIWHTSELSLATAGPLLRDASRVVIMGDSYSSGEGAGDYRDGTADPDSNMCHRSDRTYAMALGWPHEPQLLACSGATTRDLIGALPADPDQLRDEVPQLQQLRAMSPPPDLVLLTIGGNNIDMAGVLQTCVTTENCHDRTYYPNPALDDDCLRRYAEPLPFPDLTDPDFEGPFTLRPERIDGCEPFGVTYADIVFARIESEAVALQDAYEAIDSVVNSRAALRARDGQPAHMVVLAYPSAFPPNSAGSCMLGLSVAEQNFGFEVTQRLNARIGEVVAELRRQGRPIYFAADVADAFQPNNTLCGRDPHLVPVSGGRLLDSESLQFLSPLFCLHNTFGVSICRGTDVNRFREQFHPTADGYRAMTAALLRWSNRPEAEPLAPVGAAPRTSDHRLTLRDGILRLGPAPEAIVATWPAGSAVQLQGTGFAPGTTVYLGLQSAPVGAGVTHVKPDGSIAALVPLPADLPPGLHTIIASGVDPYGDHLSRYAIVEITRQSRPWRLLLWGVAVVLLLGAALGAAALRYQSHPRNAI